MKILELHKILDEHIKRNQDYKNDLPVQICTHSPSIGPRSSCGINSASWGFDWDVGLYLTPNKPLVVKTNKEELWDLAHDFIIRQSKEVVIRRGKECPTWRAKAAQEILDRAALLRGEDK